MFDFITKRIGVRVALLINSVLVVLIVLGAMYLYANEKAKYREQLLSKGRILSEIGARAIGVIFEEALDNNKLTERQVFDTEYTPVFNTDPPKYNTLYDAFLDKASLPLQDEFLEDPSVLYAVAFDLNGYTPTHNTKLKNLSKQIFVDPYTVRSTENVTEKGLLQEIPEKDNHFTNKGSIWDISTPIHVKGKHWGSFKVGIALDTIIAAQKQIRNALIVATFVFSIFSGTIIFIVVNQALKPLSRFTQIASNLADGQVDEKIEFTRQDEIGQLADVLERLRISLKAAMERLMRR